MTKKWVNIADVLFFQEGPGVRNTQYTTSGVKLLNVANLVDGKVDLSKSDRYISEEEAYGKYRHFLCDDGDFVIASSGNKVEYIDKKMGFVDASMLPLCMNTSTIRFKVLDENQLRIRYFMYYLKSKHFKEQLTKQITGSAQLNYGPSHLKKMIMPLIDITVQDEIISCMDKLQSIIETRQRELIELDRLMKARFVEMFGDYINEGGKPLSELATITGGLTKNSKRNTFNLKMPYLRVANVFFNRLDLNEILEIGVREDEIGKTLLEAGDLLFVEGNGSIEQIGRVAIWDGSINQILHQNHLIKARFHKKTILPEYALFYFMSQEGRQQIISKSVSTSGLNTLSVNKISSLILPMPPIELQERFAAFVTQVNKSKFDTMTFAPIYAIINLYLHTYFYQGRR